MAITQTGQRNLWAAVTRAARKAWFNAQDNAEIAPLALSNEYIRCVNNAGTGYVNLIKADATDTATIGTALATPSGQNPVAGNPLGAWVANYVPVANSSGTSTAPVANTQYIAPIWIESNVTLTGLAFLIGTVGGTDKAIVALYNNAGVLVANSSVTTSGSTVGTASNLQSLAFTSPYAAVGPANYWASLQISGTTARFQAIPIGVALCVSTTNATATPQTSITVPTAFNANVAPVMACY